jgi:hypothetical protein
MEKDSYILWMQCSRDLVCSCFKHLLCRRCGTHRCAHSSQDLPGVVFLTKEVSINDRLRAAIQCGKQTNGRNCHYDSSDDVCPVAVPINSGDTTAGQCKAQRCNHSNCLNETKAVRHQ